MNEEKIIDYDKLNKKELVGTIIGQRIEIEILHSIIKEAREYIEHENFKRTILVGVSTKKYTRDILNKVLEILDKVGNE